MAETKRKRRGRTNPRTGRKDTYGGDVATLDRMQEVWALRTRGYSFRAIAQQVGISPVTAWRDCQEPENGMKLMDDASIARAQILGGHRLLMDALMAEIEEQRKNGQRIEEIDHQGRKTITVKRLNHQLVGEAGRCLDRAARLLGLLDGPIDGTGGTTNTTIVLTSPADGASFEAKYGQAPPTVDATAETVQESSPAQTGRPFQGAGGMEGQPGPASP